MSNISGKDGYVAKGVDGVETDLVGIKEWNLTYEGDILDTTAMSSSGVTHRNRISVLMGWSGTIAGNHYVGLINSSDQLEIGTSYNMYFYVDSSRAYYGSVVIKNINPSVVIDGEATNSYSFEGSGKLYILGADVVVDGDFTAADSSAWDVSDADVSYDTSNDELDFSGDAGVVPASNDVIVNATTYWTRLYIKYESGTSSVILRLGTEGGKNNATIGTYVENILANGTTFTISVTTDDAVTISELIIRPILN